MGPGRGIASRRVLSRRVLNPHQRRRRNERFRSTALRLFVWAVLAVFVLTSVGVALVNFSAH